MRRRQIVAALALCATACAAQQPPARPRHKISAGELYEALSSRFPVRRGLAGMLALEISATQLLLRPDRNQLGAALLAELRGVRQLQAGEMDLVFSLRYEPSDQTVRARNPEILDVRWPGAPPEALRALQGMLPRVASDLGEFVLHRFTQDMITNAELIRPTPQVQVVMQMDGWGSPQRKKNTFYHVVAPEPVQFAGIKLFYKNDLKEDPPRLLTKQEVLDLKPTPIFIQYQ